MKVILEQELCRLWGGEGAVPKNELADDADDDDDDECEEL